jgi:hypothetical protein
VVTWVMCRRVLCGREGVGSWVTQGEVREGEMRWKLRLVADQRGNCSGCRIVCRISLPDLIKAIPASANCLTCTANFPTPTHGLALLPCRDTRHLWATQEYHWLTEQGEGSSALAQASRGGCRGGLDPRSLHCY